MNSTRRVVVTGLGAITPLGSTISETWERILRSSSGATQAIQEGIGITSLESALKAQQLTEEQFDREWSIAKHLPCQVAAAVQHPIPSDGRASRFVQLALHATKEAAMQAQLYTLMNLPLDDVTIDCENDKGKDCVVPHEAQIRARAGVCIGTGMSSVRDVSNSSILLYNPSDVPPTKRIRTMSPYFVPKVLPNSASGWVSIRYQLGGPVLSPTTACGKFYLQLTCSRIVVGPHRLQ
jgi:3-oxoacyl-[acyl-carrier-protein] synthase II